MNKSMINTRDVILALKQVKEEKELSLDKILALIEENGEFVSKTTLSRVFANGSEEQTFRYETTLRPIANALLDIENIETDDDLDTQAMKSILKLKKDLLVELENQNKELKEELKNAKLKYHEKLSVETEKFQKSLDFAKNQIDLKDKRIDQLMDMNNELMKQILSCPKRGCSE